jgi:hypothetical protein
MLQLGLKGRRGDEGKGRGEGIEGRAIGGEGKVRIDSVKIYNSY